MRTPLAAAMCPASASRPSDTSIAAVARVELRTAEQPGDGFLVRIEGGRVKAAEARWALMKGLEHEAWQVRAESAIALGRVGSWAPGPALAEALQDPDPRVRGAAALALGTLRDRRAGVPRPAALCEWIQRQRQRPVRLRAHGVLAG